VPKVWCHFRDVNHLIRSLRVLARECQFSCLSDPQTRNRDRAFTDNHALALKSAGIGAGILSLGNPDDVAGENGHVRF